MCVKRNVQNTINPGLNWIKRMIMGQIHITNRMQYFLFIYTFNVLSLYPLLPTWRSFYSLVIHKSNVKGLLLYHTKVLFPIVSPAIISQYFSFQRNENNKSLSSHIQTHILSGYLWFNFVLFKLLHRPPKKLASHF